MSEKKNPKCSRYDLRALEDWLAALSAEGWALAGEWPYFDKAEEARERRFYIEPAAEQGGVPKALLDSRATMGWEYVCNMDKGAFYVWRSVGKDAHLPRPRELADSWCDKRLTRHLRNWWLGESVAAAMLLGWGTAVFLNAEMPLWQTLTDGSAQWTICSMLLTVFCGLWATRREHRDLRRLRKAVRAGEYQEPVAQREAFYDVMRWLPMVAATAALLTTCAATTGGRFNDGFDTLLCHTIVEREGGLGGQHRSLPLEGLRDPARGLQATHRRAGEAADGGAGCILRHGASRST